MFLLTFKQVLKLFLYLLVGFGLRRANALPQTACEALAKLEVNLFIPCVALSSFCQNFTREKLTSMPEFMLASLICAALTLFFGTFVGRRLSKDPYQQNICIYSINVPNTGYVGTPLVLALFGSEMVMKMMLFLTPISIYAFWQAYPLLLERKGAGWKGFFYPPTVAMIVGALVGITSVPVPQIAMDILNDFSSCMAPIAMILTGCVIAQFRLQDILANLLVYKVMLVRMVVIPVLVLLAGSLLGVSRELLVIFAIVFSMPTSLNTVIIPAVENRDVRLGAGLACMSNVFAVVSIPALFHLFLG